MRIVLLLLCSMACAVAAAAPPTDGAGAADSASERAQFEAALDLLGRNEPEAERRFEALATARPDGEYADDALVQAAQLEEERLGHPDRARDLYAKIVAGYPTSRLALRARARLEFLTQNLGAGPEPLAEYQRILLGFAGRPTSESAKLMEALLTKYPKFSLGGQGYIWLASLAVRDGRFDEADRRFAETEQRYAGSETEALARKGRGDAALSARRPLAALRYYRSLVEPGAGTRFVAAAPVVEAARIGMVRAEAALFRLVLHCAALGYVALFVVAALLVARPLVGHGVPIELIYYLPIAGLFVAAALRQNRPLALSVDAIAAGGALIVYASATASATLAATRQSRWPTRIALAAAVAIAVLALTYSALYANDVIDFVEETLKHGPDR